MSAEYGCGPSVGVDEWRARAREREKGVYLEKSRIK